jgi:hypothetical protein
MVALGSWELLWGNLVGIDPAALAWAERQLSYV